MSRSSAASTSASTRRAGCRATTSRRAGERSTGSLWTTRARPLPRKLVISYKTEDEVPQYGRDDSHVETLGEGAGGLVPVHAAGGRDTRGGGRLHRPDANEGRSPMTRTITALIVACCPLPRPRRTSSGRSSVSARVGVGLLERKRDDAARRELHHVWQRERIVDEPRRQTSRVAGRRRRQTRATTSTRRSRPMPARPRRSARR